MENMSKEKAKLIIGDLVSKFDKGKAFYKSTDYKEANLEDDFLKPFLKALNWNISNEGIHRAADREVIVQAKGRDGKEPDYLLQLDQRPCFYIEAKHPRFKLHHEVSYMWQAYSYAYSTQSSSDRKKVDFSLLTDFEEFRFFDCTFKADLKNVNNFVSVDWLYTDYIDKFADLWDLFEKEQVRKGSLKSLYLNEKKIKANRIPPDKAFLDDLDNEKDGWRVRLAKDIKKYNAKLTAEYITTAVQLILDRLIFLKVLSDREIENDFLRKMIETLDNAALKADESYIAETLKELLAKLNETYNGSIFSPRAELENLSIGNKTLLGIVKELSPENSRYNFKQIPVEILGTIYERFLGKVVTASDQRVKIEYKPEVRKAGGVYYTPQYIVDYIVEKTVGEQLKHCKSIEDLLKLKICDPACGSGSFLLGAYDRLIQWALRFLGGGNSETAAKRLEKAHNREYATITNSGEVKLTAKLKRLILTSCIYGVDIDEQAVEVAKVSLSLKALENATHDDLREEMFSTKEKVLPSLEENIRCGNSLVGKDIYELFPNRPDSKAAKGKTSKTTTQGSLPFGESSWQHELEKLKPFDWPTAFPQVFRQEGFDAVIGNPPYVHQRDNLIEDASIPYVKSKYLSSNFRQNTYTLFVEKSLTLLAQDGIFSFIIPNYFLSTENDEQFREFLFTKYNVASIIDVKNVFDQATVFCAIPVIKKGKTDSPIKYQEKLTPAPTLEENLSAVTLYPISKESGYKFAQFTGTKSQIKLGELFSSNMGIVPYRKGYGLPSQHEDLIERKAYNADKPKGKDYWQYLTASDLSFFHLKFRSGFIKYGKNLAEPRTPEIFTGKRILLQRIIALKPPRLKATFSDVDAVVNSDIITIKSLSIEHEKYLKPLAAVLSSRYIGYNLMKGNVNLQRAVYPKINMKTLLDVPIPDLNNLKAPETEIFNKLTTLVDSLIELNLKLNPEVPILTELQMQKLRDDIRFNQGKIDELVFKLYEVSASEIKKIESAANG